MAGPDDETDAAPALVDNVETLANVPAIVAKGAGWFREMGTDASPGTIVCTVVGSTNGAGVGEVAMGTTLREVDRRDRRRGAGRSHRRRGRRRACPPRSCPPRRSTPR